MIISIDAEKAFDRIQHSFLIKALSKLGVEENFLKLIKTTKLIHFIVQQKLKQHCKAIILQ